MNTNTESTKPLEKKVSDLQIGDKIELEEGGIVTIRKIEKGWFSAPSKMITYSNGKWSCRLNSDTVTIIN